MSKFPIRKGLGRCLGLVGVTGFSLAVEGKHTSRLGRHDSRYGGSDDQATPRLGNEGFSSPCPGGYKYFVSSPQTSSFLPNSPLPPGLGHLPPLGPPATQLYLDLNSTWPFHQSLSSSQGLHLLTTSSGLSSFLTACHLPEGFPHQPCRASTCYLNSLTLSFICCLCLHDTSTP
jgi:hypothetical protein